MKSLFSGHSLRVMLFLTGLFFLVNLAEAKAATGFGVTSTNQLIRFDTSAPGMLTVVGNITGLQPGENVLGIDFRPATGQLYALGSNSRIYTLNKTTGAASLVGALTTPLNGTSFGFDFNPTVDRIRIVSNADQNLRANPNDGSNVVDGTLAFAAGDRNEGGNPNVVGAAYTNNFNGATTTMLFDIDSTLDILAAQNPANNGTLQTVGKLGVNATEVVGFDISPTGTAYGLFSVAGFSSLYTIDLATGQSQLQGILGALVVTDIAIETGIAQNFTVYAVTASNKLIRFNSSRPNNILSSQQITGLQAGENILGIDFRPATGQLYALGSGNRLYVINTSTGAATLAAPLSVMTEGANFGFDFNPTVDRIRIVSDADQNLRANPNDGATVVDGVLAYASNDVNRTQNPNIIAAAYTNSVSSATSTTLYDIDSNLDILVQQNPANFGSLITIGSLGVDITNQGELDIAPGNNVALAALQINGASGSTLFRIDLTTGRATAIAPIGGGEIVRGIAITVNTAGSSTTTLDFDGDNQTDFVLFRLTDNNWLIRNSSNNATRMVAFGSAATDILTPGDYDGDGRTDIGVWRTTEGIFYVLRTSDNGFQAFQFGQPGDEPVPRDYDGDRITDYAVVRRENGVMTWIIRNSSNGSIRFEQFGVSSDVVAPGDYDGDGRFDIAASRGEIGSPAIFYVLQSSAGFTAVQWGLGGDLIVPGDYDGDGKTDFAVVRAGTPYFWYIRRSSDNSLLALQYGTKPHFTAQGDYDGDGKTDIAVYDPATMAFYIYQSSNGMTRAVQFGQNGDYPVANVDTH